MANSGNMAFTSQGQPYHYSEHSFNASEKWVECGELVIASFHDADGIEAGFRKDLSTPDSSICRIHRHTMTRPHATPIEEYGIFCMTSIAFCSVVGLYDHVRLPHAVAFNLIYIQCIYSLLNDSNWEILRSALTQVLQRTCVRVIYHYVPHALKLHIFLNNKHAIAVLTNGMNTQKLGSLLVFLMSNNGLGHAFAYLTHCAF